MDNSELVVLTSSLIGKMSSKNVTYLDYIIVPTCMLGTPNFTTKIYNPRVNSII
jgi:hypothetical protein